MERDLEQIACKILHALQQLWNSLFIYPFTPYPTLFHYRRLSSVTFLSLEGTNDNYLNSDNI